MNATHGPLMLYQPRGVLEILRASQPWANVASSLTRTQTYGEMPMAETSQSCPEGSSLPLMTSIAEKNDENDETALPSKTGLVPESPKALKTPLCFKSCDILYNSSQPKFINTL